MSSVNWSELFASNRSDVVSFAEGTLSFKGLKRNVNNADAKVEVRKLERLYTAENRRALARRACNRRRIAVASV